MVDANGDGWGDTESDEAGCMMDPVTEEESTHTYCSITYPDRVMVDANGDGWGDTESDEAGCMMDPVTEEEVVEEETSSHAYCSEVYPGRVIADIDGNGWGDTASGEEGCMIDPAYDSEESEEESEEVTTGPTCSVTAAPSTISADGATTLTWVGSDDAVSSSLSPYGSSSVFFADVDPSNEIYISGITDSRSYVVTVTDADGNTGDCVVDITVE
jgi:hypothetical protein